MNITELSPHVMGWIGTVAIVGSILAVVWFLRWITPERSPEERKFLRSLRWWS